MPITCRSTMTPRKETHIAIVLLVCGIIIYVLHPGSFYWKSDNKVERELGKQELPSSRSRVKKTETHAKSDHVKDELVDKQKDEMEPPDLSVKKESGKRKLPSSRSMVEKTEIHAKSDHVKDELVDKQKDDMEPLDFSVKKYIQKLNEANGPKTLFAATDSHGKFLQEAFLKYLPDWKIKVSFYSGYTIDQVMAKVRAILKFISTKQRFVILHAGTNDFYRHPAKGTKKPWTSPRERNTDSHIINSAHQGMQNLTNYFPKAAVFYSANLPRADIPDYASRKEYVNREIKKKMVGIPRTHFVDHTHLFHNQSGKANPSLLVKDLLHMNDKGRDVLVRHMIRNMANTL